MIAALFARITGTPNLLTDPRAVCEMRGHCTPKAIPGTDTTMCEQCHEKHTHEPVEAGYYWLCRGCKWTRRRRTENYRDEKTL